MAFKRSLKCQRVRDFRRSVLSEMRWSIEVEVVQVDDAVDPVEAGDLAPIVERRVIGEDACLQPCARRLGIADVDEDGDGDVLAAGCAI